MPVALERAGSLRTPGSAAGRSRRGRVLRHRSTRGLRRVVPVPAPSNEVAVERKLLTGVRIRRDDAPCRTPRSDGSAGSPPPRNGRKLQFWSSPERVMEGGQKGGFGLRKQAFCTGLTASRSNGSRAPWSGARTTWCRASSSAARARATRPTPWWRSRPSSRGRSCSSSSAPTSSRASRAGASRIGSSRVAPGHHDLLDVPRIGVSSSMNPAADRREGADRPHRAARRRGDAGA